MAGVVAKYVAIDSFLKKWFCEHQESSYMCKHHGLKRTWSTSTVLLVKARTRARARAPAQPRRCAAGWSMMVLIGRTVRNCSNGPVLHSSSSSPVMERSRLALCVCVCVCVSCVFVSKRSDDQKQSKQVGCSKPYRSRAAVSNATVNSV